MTDKPKDIVLFDNTSLSDVFRVIYSNSVEQKLEIRKNIMDLANLIKNTTDAAILAPIIVGYTEAGIHNDEHLIKMAAIVQRLASSELRTLADLDGGILSEAEKQQLLKNIKTEVEGSNEAMKILKDKTTTAIENINASKKNE